jgi:hypothetical protein
MERVYVASLALLDRRGEKTFGAYAVRAASNRDAIARAVQRAETEGFQLREVVAVRPQSGKGMRGGGGARGTVGRHVDPHENQEEKKFFYRWYGKKYGLRALELDALWKCHRVDRLEQELEAWQKDHGWPATNSPLTRGKLVELIRSGRFT